MKVFIHCFIKVYCIDVCYTKGTNIMYIKLYIPAKPGIWQGYDGAVLYLGRSCINIRLIYGIYYKYKYLKCKDQ